MKGLLIKDIYNLKSFGATALIIVLLYAGISLFTGDASMLTSILLVFCATLPTSATAIDEQAKWNAYAQCLPITRKTVVQTKYVFILMVAAMSILLSSAVSLLISFWHPVAWSETLRTNLLILSAVFFVNAVTLPVVYKVGVEKGRIVTIVIFMICVLPFILFMGNIETGLTFPSWIPFAAPVLALALYIVSYFASLRIYERKEL